MTGFAGTGGEVPGHHSAVREYRAALLSGTADPAFRPGPLQVMIPGKQRHPAGGWRYIRGGPTEGVHPRWSHRGGSSAVVHPGRFIRGDPT